MFRGFVIDAITNGVHAATWMSSPFQALFDRHIAGWREDNFSLRGAIALRKDELWAAHQEAKPLLLAETARRAGVDMNPDVLTLGFARRAALYKRADLLFHDVDRLADLASQGGGLQVIYAGNAHPQEHGGKELIQRVLRASDLLRGRGTIAYLADYDMRLGLLGHSRGGCMAEHARTTPGGLWRQRHEGCPQWGPQLERPGRMVG